MRGYACYPFLAVWSNRDAVKIKFFPLRKRNRLHNTGRNNVIGCAVVACNIDLDVRAITHFKDVVEIASSAWPCCPKDAFTRLNTTFLFGGNRTLLFGYDNEGDYNFFMAKILEENNLI